MKIGLTLPNRGVLFGVTTPEAMLQMAEIADQSEAFESVWVGDSLLGKPRMESITLLAGIAARTKRVRLGPACMASFPLRDPVLLAYQWASLDLLAEGRTVLVTCTGIIPQEGGRIEGELYGLDAKDRVKRMIEWIKLMKLLWTEDEVSFDGEHYHCEGITIEPKPAAKPRPPIWIANNAGAGSGFGYDGDRALVERTLRRVVNHAEGWQTSLYDPEDLRWRIGFLRQNAAEKGRDPKSIETHLYHNININENRQAALEESKKFLDIYYSTDFPMEVIDGWVATGSPEECANRLRVMRDVGFDEVTVRLTGWDQFGQLKRLIEDVLPLVDG
jgi:alkanesulfonate monooxygenase SsuD/methylene tetrahydromethanopterin reductase-like flavin-dependent oxidoreductase (luciferase family)